MNLIEVFKALSNKYRLRIYNLCLKEELNISQISKKLDISYHSVLKNLKVLGNAGLIYKNKIITKKSQEVFSKSILFEKGSIYNKILIELSKEFKVSGGDVK